jgi:hypothetical protein
MKHCKLFEWVEESRGGELSKRFPVTGIIFRKTAGNYDLDWHPAPRRQYIINLDVGVEITASDGEKRVIWSRTPMARDICPRPCSAKSAIRSSFPSIRSAP